MAISSAAVRGRRAIRAPPPVMIDEGHCARIDRCASLGGRSLTSE